MSKHDDPLLKIQNMNRLVKFLATNTAKGCGLDLKKDKVKNYINGSNVKQVILQYAKRDKSGDYFINQRILSQIQDELTSWILGVILAKSAANDEIECSWDDTKNCMIFKFIK